MSKPAVALSGTATAPRPRPADLDRPEPLPARAPQERTPTPEPAPSMWRYLPLAIATTSLVIAGPALAARAIAPGDGALSTVASAALAVAGSLTLAVAGAALWKRERRSRDVVFAELMLWGWARRWWTERRLSRAQELFDLARRAGPTVDVERLIGLSRLLQARDSHLHGHSRRVARHATRIAQAMGLSPEEVAKIRTAAEVHDVGKLYTPRAIANNPGRLSDGELAVVRLHVADGARMARALGDAQIAAIVRHHHERVDGGGYPDGLAGAAIPLGARIIAVADTYDAITSNRAYRKAASQKHALDVLAAEAGAQLDASVVAAFRRDCSARRPVTWTALGAAAAQRAIDALGSATSSLGGGAASVGSLAPALGAAGVLALSPGLFGESHATSPAGARATAALAQAAGAAPASRAGGQAPGGAGSGGLAPGRRTAGGAPVARTLRPADGRGRTPRYTGAPGASPTPSATGSSPAGGGSASARAAGEGSPSSAAPSSAPPSSPQPSGSGAPTPPAPPLTTPSAAPPTVSTPTITTPSVSTPTISTPTVTTPSVGVGGVTVPSITVPSVTVPSVTIPSVTIPSITIGAPHH